MHHFIVTINGDDDAKLPLPDSLTYGPYVSIEAAQGAANGFRLLGYTVSIAPLTPPHVAADFTTRANRHLDARERFARYTERVGKARMTFGAFALLNTVDQERAARS